MIFLMIATAVFLTMIASVIILNKISRDPVNFKESNNYYEKEPQSYCTQLLDRECKKDDCCLHELGI